MPNDVIYGGDDEYIQTNQYYETLINADADPDQKTLWASWATELFNLKRFDKAVEKYEKAESLGAENVEFYWDWGRALATLDRFDEADEKFKKAQDLSPSNNGLLYLDWGDSLLLRDKPELAIEKYREAAKVKIFKPDALLKWGNILYDQQKYPSALNKYKKILSIDEQNVYAHFNSGLSSYWLKDYKAAKKSFENAIELDKENSSYHLWLADTLSYLKDYPGAVSEYEEALKFVPDDTNKFYTYRNLGVAFIKLEKPDEAVEQFKKAEKLRRDDGFLYVYWGDSLVQKKEPELAAKKYQKAVRFDDTKASALLKLGNIYYYQANYKSALEKYKKLLSIDDKNINAHYNIGLSSFYTGDYATAKEGFENAIKLNTKNSSYHYWLADTLSHLLDYQTAVTEYQAALKFESDETNKYYTYRNLGFAFIKLEMPGDAVMQFEKAEELRRDDGFLYIYWGDALLQKGETDIAAEKYQTAAGSEDSRTTALLKLGNISFDREDYKAAIKKYREILSIDSDHVDAQYNIGLSSFYSEDYETAKESFEKAIDLDGENSLYHYWLADTYSNLSAYKKAVAEYKDSLEFETDDANRYYTRRNLGFALLNLEKPDEAVEQFEKVEKLRHDDGFLYLYWGYALSNLNKYDDAEKKFQKALELFDDESKVHALSALGDLHITQKNYTQAIGFFEEAISKNSDDPIAYYDLGFCFFKKGHYTKANENWEKSRSNFEILEQTNSPKHDASSRYRFAILLHYIYGQLEQAAKRYEKISDELQYLEKFDKLSAYLELKDSILDHPDHTHHWKAYSEFKNIEEKLKKVIENLDELRKRKDEKHLQLNKTKDGAQIRQIEDEIAGIQNEISRIDESYTYYYLGYLYFQMSRFDEAAPYFEKAYEIKNRPENIDGSRMYVFSKSEIQNALGVCHSNLGNHQRAVTFIEKAKNEHPGDFEIQNNLASAYYRAYYDAENDILKTRYLELAEKQFEKILLLAPNNIDAIIGLGYIKLEKSDLKKQELYEEAVKNFEKALDLFKHKKGSVRIPNKLLIFVLFHLGYAYIKMYENSNRFLPDEKLRKEASNYFRKVLVIDPHNQSAIRACELLKKNSNRLSSDTFIERFAQVVITLLALVTFVLSSSSFFWKAPATDISAGYFVVLGFGALLFLIAGLSLPHLLKLKVGSIELEKEIKNAAPIKEDFSFITKQRSSASSTIQALSKQLKFSSLNEPAKSESEQSESTGPNEPPKIDKKLEQSGSAGVNEPAKTEKSLDEKR